MEQSQRAAIQNVPIVDAKLLSNGGKLRRKTEVLESHKNGNPKKGGSMIAPVHVPEAYAQNVVRSNQWGPPWSAAWAFLPLLLLDLY